MVIMVREIISLSEITPNKVKTSKELLNDQMKYLDKINKTDITKLQTTTRMIGHMAELSKSIHGNFQGLAETLNEEIAPLLEKLNEKIATAKLAVDKQISDLLDNTPAGCVGLTIAFISASVPYHSSQPFRMS